MTQVSFQGVSYYDTIEPKPRSTIRFTSECLMFWEYIGLYWIVIANSLGHAILMYRPCTSLSLWTDITWLQMRYILKLSSAQENSCESDNILKHVLGVIPRSQRTTLQRGLQGPQRYDIINNNTPWTFAPSLRIQIV